MTEGSGASDDRIPVSLQIGQVISAKFRIERVLGEGGMGVVVAATHLQLDEAVALKFLRGHSHSDPESLARFMREARAAAKLKSEHVARVLDVDVTEDGLPYIVMEYLEGQDLARTLLAEGRLPVETAAEYAIQACEGLAEAHARGIVHRDIKPENLFLVDRAQGWRLVKILDFGVSKFAVSRDVANVTTRNMMGSPCYMSPEQLLSSATVDHRTDLWSLGATLFELVSGKTAYDTKSALPVIVGTILGREPPRLDHALPGVPPELAAVVARCMSKDVDKRFANAAELAVSLLPFAPKRARLAVERAVAVTQSSVISSRERPLPPVVSAPPGGAAADVAPIAPTLPSGGTPPADAGKGAST
ncbi:MAG TPA: serine/threonine-protein kinase, partial [Polyangiaceae bacterium]|nr:serine/threonine-protein kinase [Polyangiaceae bacterium]